jgi:fatty-acid desaturase
MAVKFAQFGAVARVKPSARIALPAGVNRGGIYWRYALAVGSYHALALLAFLPWFFSWTGVALSILGASFFGVAGINLCYHRLLSHRSYRCPKWLEYFFAIVAVCCLQDTPARWVAVHRKHHHRADEEPDPHSPLASLLWAYLGWLLIENTDLSRIALYDRYARDIIRDPFYVFVERAIVWIVLLSWIVFFAAGLAAGLLLGEGLMEAVQFGASVWLWGVIVRTLIAWHITWSGNSFPHLWGYRNYETKDNSRNNIIVAIITWGEGFHNNHHAWPASASNCHRWWEVDATYLILRALVRCGLAWDVVLPGQASYAQAIDSGQKLTSRDARLMSALSPEAAATMSGRRGS